MFSFAVFTVRESVFGWSLYFLYKQSVIPQSKVRTPTYIKRLHVFIKNKEHCYRVINITKKILANGHTYHLLKYFKRIISSTQRNFDGKVNELTIFSGQRSKYLINFY